MAVRIGIGINVNTPPALLDTIERPLWPATSLIACTERKFERDALLEDLTGRFVEHLEAFLGSGISPFLPRIEHVSILARAESFVLQDGAERHRCRYRGLAEDGALVVLIEDSGETKQFYSAEIVELSM